MNLDALGWSGDPAPIAEAAGRGERVGRVAVEHRSGYLLYAESGEVRAGLAGRLRREVERGEGPGRPAVGDWVAFSPDPGEGVGTIRSVLPRRGAFIRKAAGKGHAPQVLAANVDVALLVTALPEDLNPRRIERYLALALESGAAPVVVLSKADLVDDLGSPLALASSAAPGVPVHAVSALDGSGVGAIEVYFAGGRTVALLGSSGVGKSTLVNLLLGRDLQRTQEVRPDGRGRHTTTHRELIPRPGGGLLLDTPGLREVALWDAGSGVGSAFVDVEDLAPHCRFRDCSHRTEPGCAVLAAVRDGLFPADRLAGYQKLVGELEYLEARSDPRVQAERKQHEKRLNRAGYEWMKRKRD